MKGVNPAGLQGILLVMTGTPADSNGDIEDFVGAHLPSLRRLALAWCRNIDDADEALQEALVRLVGRWSSVRTARDPSAYARTILINVLRRRRLRDAKRRASEILSSVDRSLEAEVSYEPTCLIGSSLDVALGQLTPKQRAIVLLRYYEDRPLDEVAAIFGVSSGTIKRQASRARERLRSLLEDSEPEAVSRVPSHSSRQIAPFDD